LKEFEVILSRRVLPQPNPAIYAGGDCGACVLSGALGFPDAQSAYDRLWEGKIESFSWWDMRQALFNAQAHGWIDRLVDDVPFWPMHAPSAMFGAPAWNMNLAWFSYIAMAIDAGYYGATAVTSQKDGPFGASDHWILICGARFNWKNRVGVNEILVSCSSRATPDVEWVGELDFLKQRGGFNVLLFRPALP